MLRPTSLFNQEHPLPFPGHRQVSPSLQLILADKTRSATALSSTVVLSQSVAAGEDGIVRSLARSSYDTLQVWF